MVLEELLRMAMGLWLGHDVFIALGEIPLWEVGGTVSDVDWLAGLYLIHILPLDDIGGP